ncbi:hypothetical protein BDV34DRAFT_166531 [Aspergillus parasiticus]|uniref:Uncharacterized protein n=1 Tax=Aspergillus parasiticus TaxID=5067 RepID=A0A5N6D9M6_ASPPA|nr:hypothetical protein BDV34DRAFT_166531 [Aspergillus parasiticus]
MTPNTKNDRITKLIHYSMENDSSSFCFLHLARSSFSRLPFVSVPFFCFFLFFLFSCSCLLNYLPHLSSIFPTAILHLLPPIKQTKKKNTDHQS